MPFNYLQPEKKKNSSNAIQFRPKSRLVSFTGRSARGTEIGRKMCNCQLPHKIPPKKQSLLLEKNINSMITRKKKS